VVAGWRALAATASEDPEPWLQIARLAGRARDPQVSLEAADQVLSRAAEHPEALALKLAAAHALGGDPELGGLWERLYRADPKRAEAVLDRALAQSDEDMAAVLLGASARLAPLPPHAQRRRSDLSLDLPVAAREAEQQRDFSRAAQAYWRLTQVVD